MSTHQNSTQVQTRHSLRLSHTSSVAVSSRVLLTTSISSKSNPVTSTILSTPSISLKDNSTGLATHQTIEHDTTWLPPLLGALAGLVVLAIAACFFCHHLRCRRRHSNKELLRENDWAHSISQPPPAYTSLREKSPAYVSIKEKSPAYSSESEKNSPELKLQYSPQLALSPSFTDLSGLKESSSPAPVRKIELYDPKVNLFFT
ncbi:hypothetical protein BD560DRAFT_390188 [Blakeslea trispora]|nr:hypothetical protein BD560DRAFT_390188 [Blakeslea trispora]